MNEQTNRALVLCATALATLGTVNAHSAVLEETVVTAQKREQNLQDVGISVTAFSGDQIKDLGFTNTTEIVAQTPSLSVFEFSPTLTVYNLRGVSQNSFSDSLEAPVAVYVDGAYIGAMGALNGQLFDTERVEVLRGPQGTLYGRNATGGLIHYISKAPTQEVEAYGEVTLGSYDLFSFEGSVSGALTESISARFAVSRTEMDGYLEWERATTTMGDPQPHGSIRDSYGQDALALKGALLFNLSESLDLTLRVNWAEDDDVASGAYVRSEAAQDPVTGLGVYTEKADDPLAYNADIEGAFDREMLSATAQLDWALTDSVDFVSITNYMDMDKSFFEDSEGLASGVPAAAFDTFYVDNDGNPITVQSFFPDQPAGADLPIFRFFTDQEYTQFSQELRFSGGGDNMQWQVGGYYLDIESDNSAGINGAAAWWTGGPASNFQPSQVSTSDWTLDTTSFSIFGQTEFYLNESLTLIGGLRWTEDEREIDNFIRYETKDGVVLLEQVDGAPVDISPICYANRVDERCPGDTADKAADGDYSDWAGKLQLDWQLNEDALLYFGVSKGIKGGNYSNPNFSESVNANGIDRLSHDEETLYSYEGGAKLTFADGLVRLNTAVFYYDYQDYQAFSLINFVQNISNNDAEILGLEFELMASPWDGWDFLLGGTFLDTEVEDIETPFGVLVDTEMPQAPDVSFNGLVRYEFGALGGTMALQADFNYVGEHWLEVTNSPVSEAAAYLLGNARVSYESGNQTWKLTAWVKNLGDEEYRVYTLDVAGAPTPFINDVYGRPRTYGLTASYTF